MKTYQTKNIPNGTLFQYEQNTCLRLYEICPGVMISHNKVCTTALPTMNEDLCDCILTINYSVSGICECYSVNNNYIYVKGADLVISSEIPARPFRYPTGSYSGIELYVFKNAVFPKEYAIDPSAIVKNYLSRQNTFVTDSINRSSQLFSMTFAFAEELFKKNDPDISLLRLNTLLILRLLASPDFLLQQKDIRALTSIQVNAAKKAEALLTHDLSIRIPVKKIASSIGISETSLKNHFRAVFGRNISSYLLEFRLEKAKELLIHSDLSILNIANAVGYANQSKFTAVFRRSTGVTPGQFRRNADTHLR